MGGERDFYKTLALYDSWARALLSVILPVARKPVGTACCAVLQAVITLTTRASTPDLLQASDVGHLQEAVAALKTLETSGAACCKRIVRDNKAMMADALRELRESIA